MLYFSVHGCFLDASKEFYLVDHSLLFQKLIDRGLPLPVVHFLSSWYSSQLMEARWDKSLSVPFNVSNGVGQGGVLFPILFSAYLDDLLKKLSDSGVRCCWGHLFAGAVCYADDIVLLTPCPSALRIFLNICSSFADTHGLSFNANKTQLVCFHQHSYSAIPVDIFFRDTLLQCTDEVIHLGHILTSNLNDRSDITRVVKDLNRKANSLLCVFHAADPFVKFFLLKSYCLSLYGCALWSLSSSSIKVGYNKLLRKLWCLPTLPTFHSSIVYCSSQIDTISAFIFNSFYSLLSSSVTPSSSLVRSIFSASSQCVYSFTGYNNMVLGI